MVSLLVDDPKCTRCDECVLDCPVRIIERAGEGVPFIRPENEADCMHCQHCLAICPTGALSIAGRRPEDSLPLEDGALPTLDQAIRWVRGRRSVRRYERANVDRALLDRMLAALANAPTGVNARALTFRVIDDVQTMDRVRNTVLGEIEAADEAGRLPEQGAYLRRIAMLYATERRDILFRTAPHALIVSAPPDAPCPREDVALALAYFELMAQSAGLGTVWWGLLSLALEALPHLKPMLGLPPEHLYYGMLFGPPAVRYHRTVQRDDGARIERIVL
ncbi:MAG TPA: nitroreductase family protein [Chthonomonadales bacterium]|nr:nitroreductase family protein [Chthonomonadales bacterium]